MKQLSAAFALAALTAVAMPRAGQAQYYTAPTSSSSYGVEVVSSSGQNAGNWFTQTSSSQLLAEFLKLQASDPNNDRCTHLAITIALYEVRYAAARTSGDWVQMITLYYEILRLSVEMERLRC